MKKFDPEKSIGFLLYEVSRLMRKDFNNRVHGLGLTQVQWRTISYISRYEGCNQTTLADYLEIRPITLTRLLDKLQDAGWIERRPDPGDRRAIRLYLTTKVIPLLDIMHQKALETRERMLKGFDESERESFIQFLKQMKTNLNE